MIAVPQRTPALYDAIAVAAGFMRQGRHLESVRLTVVAVLEDGSVDATETTGGQPIRLAAGEFRVVTPPRGDQ